MSLMRRRDFLALVTAVCADGLLGCFDESATTLTAEQRVQLAGLLGGPRRLKQMSIVGELWREQNKITLSSHQLFTELGLGESRSVDDSAKFLRLKHKDDFLKNRINTVNDWLLSETECRLCGLASIYKAEAPKAT